MITVFAYVGITLSTIAAVILGYFAVRETLRNGHKAEAGEL